MKLSVVIPVYNERPTIETILQRVQNVPLEKEIILVDDCSTDGTREFLAGLARGPGKNATEAPGENVRVLFQAKNRGKGAALRRGFQEARGDVVLIQDADLEYDPQEYPKLLVPLERGDADVVYGSRFLGRADPVSTFWPTLANRILTRLSNLLTALPLTDVWTCYKVFKKEVLRQITLEEDRFGFEAEVTAKIARGGWRVREVPISYESRSYAEGKKITWKDGLRGLWCTLRYRFFP